MHIREKILEGELRSGDRVPQDDIAAELGCSRLPAREAIIALEREGLVVIEPHRGAFISTITADTIRDQYEFIGTALGLALRRALVTGGQTFLDDLQIALERLVGASDAAGFDAANDQFQSLIVDAADSPRVRAALRVLSSFIPGNFFEVVPDSIRVQVDGAVAINKLARSDSIAAAGEYTSMMRRRIGYPNPTVRSGTVTLPWNGRDLRRAC